MWLPNIVNYFKYSQPKDPAPTTKIFLFYISLYFLEPNKLIKGF